MRIAIYQGPGRPREVAANLGIAARAAAQAAAGGAGLLIFPEMFLTGYNIGRADTERLAEAADGASARAAVAIAREHGVALLYGYPERAGGDLYNAALLAGGEGVLANARKAHLYGELDRSRFRAGAELVRATLGDLEIGILICFDVEFPEAVRAHAAAGVDLVAVPTALMHPWELVAEKMIPVRAFENSLYLAYANRTGGEGEVRYVGRSCIAGPLGEDLARAGPGGEEILLAEVDPARRARTRETFDYLANRRPALYEPARPAPAAAAAGGEPVR